MKHILGIFFVLLSGCGNAANSSADIVCLISFDTLDACEYQGVKVSVISEKLAADEKRLIGLKVQYKGKNYLLTMTPDTSMLDGDKGLVLFEDINFDGTPDIAITTSFGLANQFMDYWVFDTAKNDYVFIGNHARFSLNQKNKLLTNEVKVNAANYEKNTYSWDRGGLKRVDK